MPHNEKVALTGVVQNIFAHRFTIAAEGTIDLADLGPKGIQAFPLEPGACISLEGERRPSEIKVSKIWAEGRPPVSIEHKKPNHAPKGKDADVRIDPARASAAAEAAGWHRLAEPRPKPKHIELLARQGDGEPCEVHVDSQGTIYKIKPADPQKWDLDAA